MTPDNDVFKSLAQTYANNHLTMFKGSGICGSDNFPGGITNGASWYVVAGGMQVRRLYSTLLKLVKYSLSRQKINHASILLLKPTGLQLPLLQRF